MSDLGDGIAIRGYTDFTYLGKGATSIVYKALQQDLNRHVAIKILLTDDPDDPARKRFAREKTIIAKLGNHPNIVQIFEAALTNDGHPYIAMQLYDTSLADHLSTHGTLTPTNAANILADIANATQAAHDAGILHRDIKPQNILLSPYGPGLTDFGIARATTNLNWSQTLRELTPLHAAPETFLDEQPPDTRSDIWSLGSTLYTALAGRPPYYNNANEPISKYQLRLEREPLPHIPRTDITPALTEILNKTLAKNPDHRYPTATHLEHALRNTLTHALPTNHPITTEPTTRRHGPNTPAATAGTAGTSTTSRAKNQPRQPTSTDDPNDNAETFLTPMVGDGARTTARSPTRIESAGSSEPEPKEGDKRPRWLLIAGAGATVLVMFVLGVVLLGKGQGAPKAVTIPTSVAPLPVDTDHPPTDFAVADHGDSVDLRWRDNSGGIDQYFVEYRSVSGPMTLKEFGTVTAATIHALDASMGYCFRLIAIGRNASGQRTQSSVDASIRGCVATPPPSGG